jgi:opacity protein-like surface antigen
MRRVSVVLSLALLGCLPAATTHASGLDLRLGAFFPRADSNLFKEDFALYTVEKSDFVGFTGGVEFNARFAKNFELGVSVDGYGRTIDTVYRNFVRADGHEIVQTLKLDIVPVGVTIRWIPGHRHAAVQPYLGGGGDAFFWHYEEFGDFVDFTTPGNPVVSDSLHSDGVTFGGHVLGGLRFAVTRDVFIVAEGRYQWAKEHNMGQDFFNPGNPAQLDLSGPSATLGVHINF